MENFWNDVLGYLEKYYDVLVSWTPKVIIGIICLFVFYLIARLISHLFRRFTLDRAEDPLTIRFISRAIMIIIFFLGFIVVLDIIGMDDAAGKLLAGAGLSAFIIGFAFKDIGENFLAGILLAFKRPFRIGDMVEVEGNQGRITGLSLRETSMKTLDGKDIFIPNSILIKNPIINFTLDGYYRDSFIIGLDYGDDIGKALILIEEKCNALDEILSGDRDPSVVIKEFGTSTLNVEVRFWIYSEKPEFKVPAIKTKIMKRVIESLMDEGYYLPADILEVKNYNKEKINFFDDRIQDAS